ncbi:MAG: ABC transporter permease [Pseudobacteriovorax sp.]|nr:ABC transporter permease [Pseudobacteriovorax sp.]
MIDKQRLKLARIRFDLLFLLISKDLRLRYRGSLFGYLWSMLNPLLQMMVLTAVFSFLVRFKIENYPIFLLCGIVLWNLFSQSLTQGANAIIANGGLIKKVKVPVAIFPTASVASVTVHFVLSLIAFFAISFFMGHWPRLIWFLIPIYLFVFIGFIWGITLAISSLNVLFKDIGHVLDPILQLCFYGTPIIYPISVLPESIANIVALNPLTHFVGSIRTLYFDYQVPNATTTIYCFGLMTLSLLFGSFTYYKTRDKFVFRL